MTFIEHYTFCLVEAQDQLSTKEKTSTLEKQKQKRKQPCCKKCGDFMKGHKKENCQPSSGQLNVTTSGSDVNS